MFFLLHLLGHLISKLWSPSTLQRSHKGNEIEKLIVDLWMLREKGKENCFCSERAHSNFPISNSFFVRNIESTGAEQQKKFSIFWDTWMMTKCSGETMI